MFWFWAKTKLIKKIHQIYVCYDYNRLKFKFVLLCRNVFEFRYDSQQ